jgi:hypothetical protein
VKFFSGTATYRKTVEVRREWLQLGVEVRLDLGRVGDIAEVSINGRPLGTLWKAPWTIDVTDALKAGDNLIEVRVTNEWNNRLTGDRDLPADKKVLSDPGPLPGGRIVPPHPLEESGLLGPVTLSTRVDPPPDALPR